MKKILLTGAAGFIGGKTAEFLLKEGVALVGIDNLNNYYDVRLKEFRVQALKQYPHFRFYPIDIEDASALAQLFFENRFEAVINLAARAGVRYSLENPYIYMKTNALGTLNILEQMRTHQVKKIILASTSSLYAGQAMPFSEELPVNTPISPYAASKKAAEVMAYTYHHLFGIDVSVLRYFTVYGPAGRPDMSYFRFIQKIDRGLPLQVFGDGTQSRDFTYVDDIAQGTIAALKTLGYEIINLGGGKNPKPLNFLISTIEKYLGQKAQLEYHDFHKADMLETWADISKAKKILDWEPQIDLDEGIGRTVDWYKANKYWLKDLPCHEE